MTFDPAKVPGGNVGKWGRECARKALSGVEEQDWRTVHDWAKSWIVWGGGAWRPDPWLLYGVSGLLHRQPRISVGGIDLGLKNWVDRREDRAILTFGRGQVIRTALGDPRTALSDLEFAAANSPRWLARSAERAASECAAEAGTSRKRRASVDPRPEHGRPEYLNNTVAPPARRLSDGKKPEVWRTIAGYFVSWQV